jgi:hypothetical protein
VVYPDDDSAAAGLGGGNFDINFFCFSCLLVDSLDMIAGVSCSTFSKSSSA